MPENESNGKRTGYDRDPEPDPRAVILARDRANAAVAEFLTVIHDMQHEKRRAEITGRAGHAKAITAALDNARDRVMASFGV